MDADKLLVVNHNKLEKVKVKALTCSKTELVTCI